MYHNYLGQKSVCVCVCKDGCVDTFPGISLCLHSQPRGDSHVSHTKFLSSSTWKCIKGRKSNKSEFIFADDQWTWLQSPRVSKFLSHPSSAWNILMSSPVQSASSNSLNVTPHWSVVIRKEYYSQHSLPPCCSSVSNTVPSKIVPSKILLVITLFGHRL